VLHDRNGNPIRFPGAVMLLAVREPDPEENLPEEEMSFRLHAAGEIAQIEQLIGSLVEVRLINPETRVPHYILSDPHNLEVVPR
jgi:hypothetical protein